MSEIVPKTWERTAVRCFAGYKAPERPLSFLVHDREIEIRNVIRTWKEPGFLYFHVETEDGEVYDLRYHEHEDFWQMRELK